jgi:hypothetical protein
VPKARAKRLKVFQAQFGFYDSVVAAPSQPAALRAWGTHQNLFTSGAAHVVTDESAVKAALEHPETPLRRPIGSNEPFALEPASQLKAPTAARWAPPEAKARAAAAAVAKPPPDRSALDAAEAALRALDEERRGEEARLQEEDEALKQKKAVAQAAYVAARKSATAAVTSARQAYRKAGGRE